MPEVAGPQSEPGRQGELDRVLDAWNAATERLQRTHEALRAEVHRLTNELEVKNRELARKNRLADLGRMASHVAHEVRNGLAPVTLYLSLLRRRLTGDPIALRIMDNVEAGFTSLGTTVNDLLSFTQDRDPLWREFDVHELLEEVCAGLAPQLAAQDIRTNTRDAARDAVMGGSRSCCVERCSTWCSTLWTPCPDGGELH